MTGRRLAMKDVIASEDFRARVEELFALAVERGKESRRAHNRTESEWAEPTLEFLSDELRSLLEDEVIPAYPRSSDLVETEVAREVTKKALIGLRADTLRKVAINRAIDPRGTAEEVAERIARAYRYDEAEIAELILDNVEEPTAEAGQQARVFPLEQEISIGKTLDRLQPVIGRLIRTGVARWLLVDELDATDSQVTMKARLRSYRVFVNELGDHPTLGSSPDDQAFQIVLNDEQPALIIRGAGASVSRVAAQGITAVTKAPMTRGLPIQHPLPGRLSAFDPRTVVLLDLIYSRLPQIGITHRNLTIARFVTEKAGSLAPPAPDEAREYSLKAVRFATGMSADRPTRPRASGYFTLGCRPRPRRRRGRYAVVSDPIQP
jgi:hypothetical protein